MLHLHVIFSDQLSANLASIKAGDIGCDGVLMMEVIVEAQALNHHKKKLALLLSAMRHLRDELTKDGWDTDYVRLDVPDNSNSIAGEIHFADGGIMARKPYAASANYISHMSDYCENCRYRADVKTGNAACPFNALYGDFLDRNRDVLAKKPRLRNPYATWGRMSAEKRDDYLRIAQALMERLDGGRQKETEAAA